MNTNKYIVNDNDKVFDIDDILDYIENEGVKLEDLEIFTTKPIKLELNAKYWIESEIDNQDLDEFELEDIPHERLEELQKYLDEWCSTIDTDYYERDKKLTLEQVKKLLGEEEK